jgi:hypothetical protein
MEGSFRNEELKTSVGRLAVLLAIDMAIEGPLSNCGHAAKARGGGQFECFGTKPNFLESPSSLVTTDLEIVTAVQNL